MQREAFIDHLRSGQQTFDVAVIGGGANGAGIALDAASRGLRVVLVERGDFGCGTSSRSSKLIHGGVRYLAQGRWGLVREALRERARLLANAATIVKPIRFILPAGGQLERLQYALGLKLYERLGGARELPASTLVDRDELATCAPALSQPGCIGGVAYTDAQFDDSRLLLALLRAAVARGAIVANYCAAVDFIRTDNQRIGGLIVEDRLAGARYELRARAVVNATGAWGDLLRRTDDPVARGTLAPSQGAHIVVDGEFLGSDNALVLPRTPDGRIMFVLPWHGHALIGTTDTALDHVPDEPLPLTSEIDQILDVAGRYLARAPRRQDIRSVFAGIRPLAGAVGAAATSRVSREHAITVSHSGLVSVSGGKWTTYRLIAEQTVDLMIARNALPAGASTTATLALDRADEAAIAALIAAQPALAERLHPALPYCAADFVWAARGEMALHVSDALAYRTRALFIDAAAAATIVPAVANLMAKELNWGAGRIDQEIAAAQSVSRQFTVGEH